MNKRLTFKLIGKVLMVEAALMAVPLVVSLLMGGGDAPAAALFDVRIRSQLWFERMARVA